MIYEDIKRLRLEARKSRNEQESAAYTYIQGELERGEKNPTDEKSLKVLKKVHTAMVESGDTLGEKLVSIILEKYTPKQLTEEEIRSIITGMTTPNLGAVQKHFKENYPGQYEGGMLTRIFKEI